jgi:hypothetical protein
MQLGRTNKNSTQTIGLAAQREGPQVGIRMGARRGLAAAGVLGLSFQAAVAADISIFGVVSEVAPASGKIVVQGRAILVGREIADALARERIRGASAGGSHQLVIRVFGSVLDHGNVVLAREIAIANSYPVGGVDSGLLSAKRPASFADRGEFVAGSSGSGIAGSSGSGIAGSSGSGIAGSSGSGIAGSSGSGIAGSSGSGIASSSGSGF